MLILPSSTLDALSEVPLTPREAVSGALGIISIVCWFVVSMPQLMENYRNQSAEALSLAFLCIWFGGDVANLLGGLWSGLLPTAVALAVWFCITDVLLLAQSLYYGIRNRRREGQAWLAALRQSVSGDVQREQAAEAIRRVDRQQDHQEEEEDDDEEQPLLKRTMSTSNQRPSGRTDSGNDVNATPNGVSPAARRSSINDEMRARRVSIISNNTLSKVLEEQASTSSARLWIKNLAMLLLVWVFGVIVWFAAYKTGTWKPVPLQDPTKDAGPPTPPGALILGYISAVLYLGARLPQIYKNYREQSCEGLSLLFFMLSLSGNLSNGLSFLAHSTEREYVLKSLPWMIGSLGTIAEDVVIFVQIHLYGSKSDKDSAVV